VLCAYFYSTEHVIEECPNLLKKWEETKTHCNMVHVEFCKNKKKDEEVDFQVITYVRANTRRYFEQTESSGQKSEGKIIKETQPPHKFNATKQKKFMGNTQRSMEEERVCEEL